MKYNFDEIIDRKNTNCLKYDFAVERGRPENVLPFWVADMDFRTPPEVVEALIKRVEHGIFGYSSPKTDYFQTVSNWFERRHGWKPNPDGFVITCSVVFALSSLIRAVTNEGDAVIICQPVYYPFSSCITQNNRKLVVSELTFSGGKYEIDFDDFERKIVDNGVKAFILCSPHNPVGRVWTKTELVRLGDICLRHGVFVISDEIHADFTYAGYKHTVFTEVKEEFKDICAVCTAPTKTFNLAGLHVSNIYVPNKEIREKLCADLDMVGFSQPNVMGMTACAAAYKYGEQWLDELKSYLTDNLNFTREYLKKNLPEITLIEPEATYLIWLDCRKIGLSDSELQNLVEQKAGLWLDDGYIFGQGGSGFERINIACPRAILKEGLDRFASAVQSLR